MRNILDFNVGEVILGASWAVWFGSLADRVFDADSRFGDKNSLHAGYVVFVVASVLILTVLLHSTLEATRRYRRAPSVQTTVASREQVFYLQGSYILTIVVAGALPLVSYAVFEGLSFPRVVLSSTILPAWLLFGFRFGR